MVVARALRPISTRLRASRYIVDDPENNVTPYIANLVGKNLHQTENHPLYIIRKRIESYFGSDFEIFDNEDPIVTTTQCFDDLLIPPDHPGRQKSDTYYVTKDSVLRTHTSAHQSQHLRAGHQKFLCTGDVYRRDEIDSSHFPAFHQMEGVKLLVDGSWTSRDEWLQSSDCEIVAKDLKTTLEGMVDHVFQQGSSLEKRWRDDYFPFTEPSFELDILWQGEWMEVLGCGVIHTGVLERCDVSQKRGWAFGLGLERLAMVLFGIPDIRLFWTQDPRFHSQFTSGDIVQFKPYSKYPPVYKDIAFWLPENNNFEENDFFELARELAGDLVEQIALIDKFKHPKTERTSCCYRVTYRSMDRSLTDVEINQIQDSLREKAALALHVQLR
ncbi:hypothetical protein CTAYLR_000643 [Chrysophaeum taylorii]|uniref:phenylalanine--tRNA ligase n=1 Tax=Chrysophaeum taylorii TaxID=2483200 RepID=A0AAD7U8Q1_9STRA|nr:hypothetical protein CTAYLR_000643 [Chrysophaeum taylorii]